MYDIAIIGGGASGMLAAIECARQKKSVILLEANDRIGKKLLATGNGRCNILNAFISDNSYNTGFVYSVLSDFTPQKLQAFFEGLGIPTFEEREGRLYPVSESTASVLNILRRHLESLQIKVLTSFPVTDISYTKNTFITNNSIISKKLIFAAGSPATTGYDSLHLLAGLGHGSKSFRPSLCPVRVDKEKIKGLKNVRLKATVRFNGFAEKGEIQFREDAISGIPAFQLSEMINRTSSSATIFLDLLPRTEDASKYNGLYGLFPPAAARALEKYDIKTLKSYRLGIAGLYPMKSAQIANGGLDTSQFDSATLESRLINGLYAAGEALDVSGLCGGYNLMWAWASALAAARSACND